MLHLLKFTYAIEGTRDHFTYVTLTDQHYQSFVKYGGKERTFEFYVSICTNDITEAVCSFQEHFTIDNAPAQLDIFLNNTKLSEPIIEWIEEQVALHKEPTHIVPFLVMTYSDPHCGEECEHWTCDEEDVSVTLTETELKKFKALGGHRHYFPCDRTYYCNNGHQLITYRLFDDCEISGTEIQDVQDDPVLTQHVKEWLGDDEDYHAMVFWLTTHCYSSICSKRYRIYEHSIVIMSRDQCIRFLERDPADVEFASRPCDCPDHPKSVYWRWRGSCTASKLPEIRLNKQLQTAVLEWMK